MRHPLIVAALVLLLFLIPGTLGYGQSPTSSAADPAQQAEAQQTTLKEFPKNLGRDFIGLFCRDNLLPLMVGVDAAAVSSLADDPVHIHFSSMDTTRPLGSVGQTMGNPAVLVPAIGGLFAVGLLSKNTKFHSFTYALAEGFVLNSAWTGAFKYAVGRERPDSTNSRSFPSAHTSDYFMIAATVDHYYGHIPGIVMYGVASYVGASRLVSDKHWLSDVVAGATLGYIVGSTVSRRTGGLKPRKVTWTPIVNPTRKTFGVALAIRIP